MSDPASDLRTLIALLEDDNHLGILSSAQVGAATQEIQLMLQVADYDAEHGHIRPLAAYRLRCLDVREQRLSLGLFKTMFLVKEHPLLWNHNFPYQQVYFRGEAGDSKALILDLHRLYAKVYGAFRSLYEDLNRAMSLDDLFGAGRGLLGEMPLPMAQRVQAQLEQHGLSTTIIEPEQDITEMPLQLLSFDESFLVLASCTAQELSDPLIE